MAVIARGDLLHFTIRQQELKGYAISEVPGHITVRLAAADVPLENDIERSVLQQFLDMLKNDVKASYRQGNYQCTFKARMLNFWPDRSCSEGSFIMQLSVPDRVQRIFDPVSHT